MPIRSTNFLAHAVFNSLYCFKDNEFSLQLFTLQLRFLQTHSRHAASGVSDTEMRGLRRSDRDCALGTSSSQTMHVLPSVSRQAAAWPTYHAMRCLQW